MLHSLDMVECDSFRLAARWATAEEDRLNIKRDLYTSFAAASDCRTIAIYESPRPRRWPAAICCRDRLAFLSRSAARSSMSRSSSSSPMSCSLSLWRSKPQAERDDGTP
jgi:hypothetical protein